MSFHNLRPVADILEGPVLDDAYGSAGSAENAPVGAGGSDGADESDSASVGRGDARRRERDKFPEDPDELTFRTERKRKAPIGTGFYDEEKGDDDDEHGGSFDRMGDYEEDDNGDDEGESSSERSWQPGVNGGGDELNKDGNPHLEKATMPLPRPEPVCESQLSVLGDRGTGGYQCHSQHGKRATAFNAGELRTQPWVAPLAVVTEHDTSSTPSLAPPKSGVVSLEYHQKAMLAIEEERRDLLESHRRAMEVERQRFITIEGENASLREELKRERLARQDLGEGRGSNSAAAAPDGRVGGSMVDTAKENDYKEAEAFKLVEQALIGELELENGAGGGDADSVIS